MSIRVAVDAMGGDHAPDVVVQGAVRAASKRDEEIRVVLVGPEALIREKLEAQSPHVDIDVVDAPEVIEMAESPATAVKKKTRSSIHIGLSTHQAGDASAFVSAGNTGAVMAASLFILGRLPGVARPAILSVYPTLEGFCNVVDVGANVDCRPEHLLQFAEMATIYVERVLKKERPRVALLSIGEERSKGNDVTKEAYEMLEAHTRLNFVGNIEGRDVMRHAADVVICDGFVGNIILKLGESIATVLPQLIGREMERQKLSAEQQQLVVGVLKGVQRRFDYEEYGGTPLLGVAGTVLIGHGGSTARAIENMILAAAEMASRNVAGSIEDTFSTANGTG